MTDSEHSTSVNPIHEMVAPIAVKMTVLNEISNEKLGAQAIAMERNR